MTDDALAPPEPPTDDPASPVSGDDTIHRALFAGLAAAIAGGALWAAIVLLTKYEVGYVAWAVGGLVGFVMARATAARGPTPALLAAVIATLGLLAGKAVIASVTTSPRAVAREVQRDDELMLQAAMFDLHSTETWPEPVQARLDELATDDTLPDALWLDMQTAAATHASNAGPDGRQRIATAYAGRMLSGTTSFELFRAQFGLWDVLWFGLAVVTAWRLLRGGGAPATAEPAAA
ncbi:MAG: hypothetical protein OER21_08435 [Gemmatimonadota bacterium]|nr:hypothetical protein [Gemmatimonadota bacterium]